MNKIVFIILLLLTCQCWSAETDGSQYSPLNQPQETNVEYSPLRNLKTEQLQKKESLIIAKGSLEKTQQEEVIASKERNLQYQLQKEAIKKRIQDYIHQGALPAPPPTSITVNGRRYSSYESFLNSTEGQNWLAWQRARHTWNEQKKKIDAEYEARLRRESFQRLVEYEKLSWSEKRHVEAKKRVEAFMGHPGPYMREPVYIAPQKKSEEDKNRELEERLKKADAEIDKYLEQLPKEEYSEH